MEPNCGRCFLLTVFLALCIGSETGGNVSLKESERRARKIDLSINVESSSIVSEVDSRFYSFNMGCNLSWSKRGNLSSPTLKTLAKELAPAYIRLGGTECDCMTFCEGGLSRNMDKYYNVTLTGKLWDELNSFVEDVGFYLVLGANVRLRKSDGTWDPSNFQHLLGYSSRRDFTLDFELGNEPSSFHHRFNETISPEQLAEDFKAMKTVLQKKQFYQESLLVGPDSKRLIKGDDSGAKEFLKRFLDAVGDTIDVASTHFYYKNRPEGVANLEFLTDPATLDQFVKAATEFKDVVKAHRPPGKHRMWIGESGILIGAMPAVNISDRFISGMVWLDKLGIAALNNVEVVIRESLFASGGRSVFSSGYHPRPDYWGAVLYKRVVGVKVLAVNISSSADGIPQTLRLYAHCTKTDRSRYGYKPGAVSVFVINFDKSEEVKLMFHSAPVDQFLFTPSRSENITSPYIALNGHELSADGGTLPDMPPLPVSAAPVVPPWSMGFYILKDADYKICKK